MKILFTALLLVILLPSWALAQDDDDWPSLAYLRSDYKSVAVVAHIRIQQAEITNRIAGYENWRIVGEVLEPFKGKFKKGDVIEYFHGAEAGIKKEHFTGEKLVFLLAEYDRDHKLHYSVLENSTLPYTADRARKLRLIKKRSKQTRRSRNHSLRSATTSAQLFSESSSSGTQPTSPR